MNLDTEFLRGRRTVPQLPSAPLSREHTSYRKAYGWRAPPRVGTTAVAAAALAQTAVHCAAVVHAPPHPLPEVVAHADGVPVTGTDTTRRR